MPVMPISAPLIDARRIPYLSQGDRVRLLDLATLVGAGALSATLSWAFRGWGIPGSAVVQGVLPLAAGLALVPRRGAGIVMGISAMATTFVLSRGHEDPSLYARLLLLNLALDAGLALASSPKLIWPMFIVAGATANSLGYGAKLFFARLAWEDFSGKRGRGGFLATWQGQLLSWTICGAVAGAFCAVAFFRNSRREAKRSSPTTSTSSGLGV